MHRHRINRREEEACGSPHDIEAAFCYAYRNIKATDVVLVGIWQTHGDQVSENVAIVRKTLTAS